MKTSILKLSAITPLIVAAGMFMACASNVQAVTFNYSSTLNSVIVFPGDTTFHFTPAANNFMVTSGTAGGLLGDISGTFTIGTITFPGPGVEQAPVTGSGMFVIHDGAFNLTATLTWVDITQMGTGNTLNVTGMVNLTNIMYGGSNPDLVALANAGSGINVLTFQFIPAVPLTVLRNGPGSHSTSFSGTVATVPDGGMTVAFLGLALAGVEGLRRRVKRAKA